MAVIDLYTRRVLGPKEIRERANYQPQALGEDWSFADDMVDHDLARLLKNQLNGDDPGADDADNPSFAQSTNDAQSSGGEEKTIERYARWMALGHRKAEHQHTQQKHKTGPLQNAFQPDMPDPDRRHSSSSPHPSNPSPEVMADREQLYRDIERARLTQTADDLRGAAQRLRHLAGSLRETRDRLYEHNQRRDQDKR